MRWQVTTKANPGGEGVLADRVDVIDGALIFSNVDGDDRRTVIAYAAGQWLVSWPEEA